MMAEPSQRLVLASASPRRRLILEQLGIAFEVIPSSVEEERAAGEPPAAFAGRMAALKADEVTGKLRDNGGRSYGKRSSYVLGADTVVVIDDQVLGKPQGDEEARQMLSLLGGRTHQVITAVALRRAGTGLQKQLAVSTRVSFRPLDAGAIARYVASGEGRDKAGSYAIQGLGIGLVSEIDGSYSNVVGLPAVQTVDLLLRAGALKRWP
jgi:septum formation protein